MKHLIFTTIFILLTAFHTIGQTKILENALKPKPKNFSPIIAADEVKGYVMFSELDELGSNQQAYRISFIDNNLNEVNSIDFKENKGLFYINSTFNGSSIMIQFFNKEYDQLIFKMLSTKGNEIKKEIIEIQNEFERSIYNVTIQPEQATFFQNTPTLLTPISNKGFVNYGYSSFTEGGYKIRYFPEDKNKEKWTMESPPGSKEYWEAKYLYQDQNILFSTISKRRNKFTSRVEFFIQAIDIDKGELLFEIPTKSRSFNIWPSKAQVDQKTGNIQLFGMYFEKRDKAMKSNGLGLASLTLDRQGNIIGEAYNSWAEQISNFVPVDKGDRIGEGFYVYIHETIRDDQGNILVIGEKYKKGSNEEENDLKLVGQGREPNLIIGDLVIFKMDETFRLTGVRIIFKEKKYIEIPYYLKTMNTVRLGSLFIGTFEYQFFQKNKNTGDITAVYTEDLDKEKSIGVISVIDDEISNTKSQLKNEDDSIVIKNAKPGHMMIWEYDEDKKNVKLRIEKLNY